jgi:hypothetical protein
MSETTTAANVLIAPIALTAMSAPIALNVQSVVIVQTTETTTVETNRSNPNQGVPTNMAIISMA